MDGRIAMHQALLRAIAIYGSQSATAAATGRTQPAISYWIRKKAVCPDDLVLKVESDTGVSRYDLRSDLFQREAPAAGAADLEPAR